jgi:hypothetical protein
MAHSPRSTGSEGFCPDRLVAIALCFAAGFAATAACGSTKAPRHLGAAGAAGGPVDGGGAGRPGTAPDGGAAGQPADGSTPQVDAQGGEAPPPPTPVDLTVVPSFEPKRPSTDCAAALATVSAPVLLDAAITCAPGNSLLSFSAAPAGAGFMAVAGATTAGASQVVAVSATGAVTGDQGPVGIYVARVIAEPDGGVDLVGIDADRGLSFFHTAAGGWTRELVLPPVEHMISFEAALWVDGVGRAPDGRIDVAFTRTVDIGGPTYLATRSPAGHWTELETPFVGADESSLVVPPVGPAILVHEIYTQAPAVAVAGWVNGADSSIASVPKADDITDYSYMLDAAATSTGSVAVSLQTPREGVVVVRPAGASPRAVALAGTQVAVPTGCPTLPANPTMVTAPMTCVETGIGGGRRHALAAAADGTLWVAYELTHVDHDVAQSCVPGFSGGIECGGEITQDRSTTEIVLEHVAADGGHAIRWRSNAGVGQDGPLFMNARDGHVALAFSVPHPPVGQPTFRYVLVDTSGL